MLIHHSPLFPHAYVLALRSRLDLVSPYIVFFVYLTTRRIKKNDYQIPPQLSAPAVALLRRLLADDPTERPNLDLILADHFFTCAFMPPRLPTSCLTMPPRFDKVDASFRQPGGAGGQNAGSAATDQRRVLSVKNENERADKMEMGRVYVVNKMFAGYKVESNPLDALNKLELLNEALKDENKVIF